jgi:hypothetical protein
MKTHKTNLILLLFLFISTVVFAQNATSIKYGEQITQDVLRKHISVLASDSLEGRDTGTPGMRKAAAYVTDVFTSTGVQPALSGSYLQQMPFIRQTASSITISSESKPFIFGDDFIVTDLPSQLDLKISEIIFAGYGIMDSSSGWNDYLNVDVKGKTIIIFDDEPFGKKGKSPITKTKEPSAWSKSDEQKIKIAYDKGANAVLLVNNDMKGLQRVAKRWMTSGRLKLVENKDETFMPVIHISDNMADELLKTTGSSAGELKGIIGRTGKPKPFVINQQLNIQITSEKVFCTNIIGVVEGSDKKEEVIVVSAHIDHLGKRDGKIYYGADDDASGCAAVMAMGEQFAKAKKEGNGPRRTIVFVTFSAEEKGLLGSRYYVNNPVFPLENTIANLNIDMIGRSDTIARNTTNYTYIIGSDKLSSDLHLIHENANAECCEVTLDYKYNDEKDPLRLYYRSDHYNFVKNNIPAIFYFTGLHEDYHQPTDTVDKIDFSKAVNITRLIFNTAWELANREDRITLD